jgi:hypothetical protein
MNNSMTDESAMVVCTNGTLCLIDFHMWGYIKNMVYEQNVGTRDELLQQIFDAARCVNDITVLCKVNKSGCVSMLMVAILNIY